LIYRLTAECIFPVYELNSEEKISEIVIDATGRITIKKEKTTQIELHRLFSPYEMQAFARKERSNQVVKVTKVFMANDFETQQIQIMNSISEIENFISWMSLITLEEYRIIKWGEIHSEPILRKGKIILSVGKKFNLPIDTHPLNESGDYIFVAGVSSPKRVNNLEKWLQIRTPKEIHSSLRWYRKGLISYFPEEKIIFWVTALEIISGMISEDTEIVDKCNICGNETMRRPSVNKKALFEFITQLGFTKKKTFDVIQKFRSKYAHGGNENFNYFNEDINLVINATKSLLILFFTQYFISKKVIKPELQESWLINHPIYGDVSLLIENIRKLAESNLSNKVK
jgi:hypothetical protein